MSQKDIFNKELIKYDISTIQELSQKFKNFKLNQKNLNKNITISISSDYTTNYFTDVLRLFLINKKIQPKIIESEYGSLKFHTKDPDNSFWKTKSDFFILMPSSKNFSGLSVYTTNPFFVK